MVAVQLLPSTPTEGSRSQLGDVLGRLSDALRERGRGDTEMIARAERVHVLAGDLRDRTPSALPPQIVDAALREAVGALEQQGPRRPVRQLEKARAGLGKFDTSRPILAQIGVVRSVLGDVADGLLVAAGLEPVVRSPESTRTGADSETPGSPVSVEAARRASGLVSQVAIAPSAGFRSALAAALEGFADVLAHASVPADRSRADRLVVSVRADARKIRQLDQLGPDAAPVAKAGLGAALDGVEELTRSLDCSVCNDWTARARAALNAVDDHTFVAFQRGPLQEACRLIADVLVLAADPAWRGHS